MFSRYGYRRELTSDWSLCMVFARLTGITVGLLFFFLQFFSRFGQIFSRFGWGMGFRHLRYGILTFFNRPDSHVDNTGGKDFEGSIPITFYSRFSKLRLANLVAGSRVTRQGWRVRVLS